MTIKEYHEFDPGKEFNKNIKELPYISKNKKKEVNNLADNDEFMLIFTKYLDTNEGIDEKLKKSTLELSNMAKEEFAKRFPQEAIRYEETIALVQKNNHSERKGELEKSIQKTEEDLRVVREKMGVPIPVEKAPSTLTDHAELGRIEANLAKIEERIEKDEKQGELVESFLERDYGINRDAHIDKVIEGEQSKDISEYLSDKPEDKDIKVKQAVGDKMDKIREESPEREGEEVARQKEIGGVLQESKGVIEGEDGIGDDLESEKESLSFVEKVNKVENFQDLDVVLGELGEIRSTHDGQTIFSAEDMRVRINDLRENIDQLKEEINDPEFLAYAKEYGIDKKIIELLKKEMDPTGENAK